jgi:hypothetical protein
VIIGNRRIQIVAARTIIALVEVRILARTTTAEETGTIVRRILTGSKRQPPRHLMCNSVCGI